MYAIIVGAGKVGRNLAQELMVKGHEVTLIESSRSRYLAIEEEFVYSAQYGDATELGCSSAPACSGRPCRRRDGR